MSESNITLNPSEKYLQGISKVTEVIRSSYGPFGTNVVIHSNLFPGHIIANDADSIIQNCHITDPIENKGLDFIKELSAKQSKVAGEGRKTTIIIAEELLKRGFKEGMKGMTLKNELDKLLPSVLDALDKQSQRVELEDIKKVAKTASRSDKIADWIQKIYLEIGRDGIIQVESSNSSITTYQITNGVKFNAGWLTPYMAYGSADSATYEKPLIMVTKRKIEKIADIEPILQGVVRTNRPLVILADDMDNNVAVSLIKTHVQKEAKILIIRVPTLFKNYVFEDFAKCVGATVIEDATGLTFKGFNDEHFGTCDKLTTSAEETILQGICDIESHKNALRKDGSDDSLRRLEWLNAKTAILRLGTNSESELSYTILKTKDAIQACKWALDQGIVDGAGMSLVKASGNVATELNGIFYHALQAPYEQLKTNSFPHELDTTDIYDASVIVKNAIRNAVSLAGIVLTTGADIRFKDQTDLDKQLEILYKQRNPF